MISQRTLMSEHKRPVLSGFQPIDCPDEEETEVASKQTVDTTQTVPALGNAGVTPCPCASSFPDTHRPITSRGYYSLLREPYTRDEIAELETVPVELEIPNERVYSENIAPPSTFSVRDIERMCQIATTSRPVEVASFGKMSGSVEVAPRILETSSILSRFENGLAEDNGPPEEYIFSHSTLFPGRPHPPKEGIPEEGSASDETIRPGETLLSWLVRCLFCG